MPSVHDKKGVNGPRTVTRKFDAAPAFRNDILGPLKGGKVPYTKGQTYADPDPDREEFLNKTQGLNVMQKHCVFFDPDLDGVVWPQDTFWGFYALGFGAILSLVAVFVVHSGFSYPTGPDDGTWKSWLPDPFFRIWIANIQRCKHGSDSESYNRRGEFQEEKLNACLDDYSSHEGRDSLTLGDAWSMMKGRRNLFDIFGLIAFAFEWGSTYMLLWPADGRMKKRDIVGVINGSIFPELAYNHMTKGKGGAFRAK